MVTEVYNKQAHASGGDAVYKLFVFEPRSAEIAAALNVAEATTCEHGLDPCYLRCGVERVLRPGAFGRSRQVWLPIPAEERWRWLGAIRGNYFQGRDRRLQLCTGCNANPCRCLVRRRCAAGIETGRCGAVATVWCPTTLVLACDSHEVLEDIARIRLTPRYCCNRKDCPLCNYGSLGKERGYDPSPFSNELAREWFDEFGVGGTTALEST